jgi:hypothetical protein
VYKFLESLDDSTFASLIAIFGLDGLETKTVNASNLAPRGFVKPHL